MEHFVTKLRQEQNLTIVNRMKAVRGTANVQTRRRYDDVNAIVLNIVERYQTLYVMDYLTEIAKALQIKPL